MGRFLLDFGKLFIGLFLYGVGIVCTINANLGLMPWDVFHQGLGNLLGITMGQASILVGLVIVLANWLLGEKIGIGTLCNMVFIGLFLDLLMQNNVIPQFDALALRILMMFMGLFIIGIATYFYLSVGWGAGPRDGLMVALTKRTNKSVRFIRNSIEVSAVTIGFLLGGSLGLGTLAMALSGGYFIQLAFKLFRFDVKALKHHYLEDHVRELSIALKRKNSEAEIEETSSINIKDEKGSGGRNMATALCYAPIFGVDQRELQRKYQSSIIRIFI